MFTKGISGCCLRIFYHFLFCLIKHCSSWSGKAKCYKNTILLQNKEHNRNQRNTQLTEELNYFRFFTVRMLICLYLTFSMDFPDEISFLLVMKSNVALWLSLWLCMYIGGGTGRKKRKNKFKWKTTFSFITLNI